LNQGIRVIKRDGSAQPLSIGKIVKAVNLATNYNEEDSNKILEKANLYFYDKMKTENIHKMLIKAAKELISLRSLEFDTYAVNLYIQDIEKQVKLENNGVKDFYTIAKNHYKIETSDELLKELSEFLENSSDIVFKVAGIETLINKYLMKNPYTGRVVETPKAMYMGIACAVFKNNKQRILEFYEALSTFKISLPTPQNVNLRTGVNDFSSCATVRIGDNLDSWATGYKAILELTSKSNGLGIDISDIASLGDLVKGGRVRHSGKFEVLKTIDALVNSVQQANRRGAATIYVPFFDPEIEMIFALKSPRTEVNKRINDLKFTPKVNKLFYKRVAEKGKISLFSTREFPKLLEYLNSGDNEAFEAYYIELEKKKLYKRQIDAEDYMNDYVITRTENGIYYLMNMDNTNINSPYKLPINQSNLCVVGDTKILTREGYKPIKDLENTYQDCWNGKEWSKTEIRKTGENSKVLKVVLDNYTEIEATPYHKWYVQEGYGTKPVEKRTYELQTGDKLIKFNLEPVTHGTKELPYAYENGFLSGDGCEASSKPHIDLHDNKQLLLNRFAGYDRISHHKEGRITKLTYSRGVLKPKFFVPDSSYSVKSRLLWLAGYFDSDGTLTNNQGTESIQAVSINLDFLKDIQLLLQELGVYSTIRKATDAGYKKLPANDGTGEYKEYWCKDAYRLLVAGSGLNQLLDLGYEAGRVMPTKRYYQRQATQFTKVVEVIDEGKFADTWCGNEPKEHKLMFNGVLTGNCNEFLSPLLPISSELNDRQTGICILSNINMGKVSKEELPFYTKLLVEVQNILIGIQMDSYTKAGQEYVKAFKSIGLGLSNYAYFLAKNKVRYGSEESLKITEEYVETFQYYMMKASMELAKEFGEPTKFREVSTYLDPNSYKRREYIRRGKLNWQWLFEQIDKNGMANCTLTMIPPSETSSVIGNQTSGLEPIKDLITIKESGDNLAVQVAPEALELAGYYDFAFDTKDLTRRYLKNMSIFAFWVDMAISINTFYNPELYEDNKLPSQVVTEDIFFAYKNGIKTIYYSNVKVADGQQVKIDTGCAGGACEV
jgi:ribonucleoside-diphosphate reductase alpha chain